MAVSTDVVFTPALGQVVTIASGDSKVALYATSANSIKLVARFEGGTSNFEQIDLDSTGNLLTYKTSFTVSELPESIAILADGAELDGKISFVRQQIRGKAQEFFTEVTLEESEDFKSQKIEWLNVDDWEGWAWYRPRETWIESSFTPLNKLKPDTPTHSLLLRPTNANIDSKSVLAVFPASPPEAFVHLTGAREGEAPGVYARVRRVHKGGRIVSYITGKLDVHRGELRAIRGAIDVARARYGYPDTPFTQNSGQSPFESLGFCTWSSIGEDVPLTYYLMEDLVNKLARFNVPIGTFIIDDGWQDIRYGQNGSEKTRGLWSFNTWEHMNSPLSDVVSLVKKTLPTVKDVGVWMTLHGYWNSIAPNSPLAKKYEMQTFQLSRDNIQGIDWPTTDFDGQQSGSISDPSKRTWCLPPPHLAYSFWKDYFMNCFEAGITFVKVDDQAYGCLLDGVSGGEEFVALWNGMTRAANEVFGENKVIHCMAHYERTFNGDIGMGVATQGKKVVIRNSDDFGLDRPDYHRNHIHHNIYNAMLTSQLCLIPDPDMFMTSDQWPDYHAVLRAFFEGPVLLADKPGKCDLEILNKLVGRSPTNNYEVVRAPQTIRPLSRNVWEEYLSGHGPAIKGVSYFPKAKSASLVFWSARKDALGKSADLIFEGDIIDALEGSDQLLSSGEKLDFALWLSNTRVAKSIRLIDSETDSAYETTSSPPVMSLSLDPEGTETLTVAPYQDIGTAMVASLGLIDKYAGLASIQKSEITEGKLSIDISFDGIVGFLVRLEAEDIEARAKITVDNATTQHVVTSKGKDLCLVEVDLRTIQAVPGKDCWTVNITIGKATNGHVANVVTNGLTNGITNGIGGSEEDIIIKSFDIYDLRFPTSLDQSGSDAMNVDADYSASYIILRTSKAGLDGHGFAFTIGRGNDLVCAAARYVAGRLVGKSLSELTKDMGKTWRLLVSDSQLRWVGPEKGVIHLGLSTCINALWDLWARHLEKPVWQVVAEMSPEEFVRCIDFRYITDAITPEEAIAMLTKLDGTKADRIQDAKTNSAVPAYSTQAGWLGFSDERMTELMHEMLAEGFDKFKLKVGGNLEDDIRRLKIARDIIGYDRMLMVDANQVWSVPEAIEYMLKLVQFKPDFIEEPTSPDDILGHATIRRALKPYGVGVATGEHCQNRVMFKQLLQAGSIDFCQIDACRLGGVNEVMAVLLMAKKFNVPIVPHSGGIGLNEYTQHLALINYISVAGEKSLLENINSFSEVLTHPAKVQKGHFVTPWEAGYSVEYKQDAILKYQYPHGEFWNSPQGLKIRNEI